MVVRVRLQAGPRIRRTTGKNRNQALAFASLLWPAVLMAYVLALWRLGADLGVTGGFAISNGVFSHWQVWLAVAIGLNIIAVMLNRYGRGGRLRIPITLVAWVSTFGNRRIASR
jgi:hypothetical protein